MHTQKGRKGYKTGRQVRSRPPAPAEIGPTPDLHSPLSVHREQSVDKLVTWTAQLDEHTTGEDGRRHMNKWVREFSVSPPEFHACLVAETQEGGCGQICLTARSAKKKKKLQSPMIHD